MGQGRPGLRCTRLEGHQQKECVRTQAPGTEQVSAVQDSTGTCGAGGQVWWQHLSRCVTQTGGGPEPFLLSLAQRSFWTTLRGGRAGWGLGCAQSWCVEGRQAGGHGWKQCWHRRVGDWHRGGGLVHAATGLGARLARGEVLGSHAGRVLEERGGGQWGPCAGRAASSLLHAVCTGWQKPTLGRKMEQCTAGEPKGQGAGEEPASTGPGPRTG